MHAHTALGEQDPLILGLITAIVSMKSLAALDVAFDCPRESGGLRVGTQEGSVLCGDRFGLAVGKRRRVGNKAGRLRIRAVRLLPFWLFNEPVVEMIAVRTNTIR